MQKKFSHGIGLILSTIVNFSVGMRLQHPTGFHVTHSVVMSSSLGGTTGVGPVTAIVLPPGVCLPFGA